MQACVVSELAGDLDNAAVGRKLAAQNHKSARFLDGVIERADHLLARRFRGVLDRLSKRLPGQADPSTYPPSINRFVINWIPPAVCTSAAT